MTRPIELLTATELLGMYRRRQISPVEVTKAVLARIEARNAELVAYRFVAPDEALAAAKESEARWMKGEPKGLVDGVPTSIKDQWAVKGWTSPGGSIWATDAGPMPFDSPQTQRMREHGAVLLGKTAMCEFGWKGAGDSSLTGSSRNPWNPAKTAGGSSGGAAIAAATGMGYLNLGSDGAGSIRMPAAFCGIFGFKSTYARVPAFPHGFLPMCSHSGPMVRSVQDAALMLSVITESDPRDWLGLPPVERDWRVGLEDGVRGLRIAYSRNLGYAWIDPKVVEVSDRAVQTFRDLGAEVVEVDPGFPSPREAFEVIYASSLAATYETLKNPVPEKMDPGYIQMVEKGRRLSAIDVIRALKERDNLGRHMNQFHEDYDLLITPQLSLTAFDCGQDYPPGLGMKSWFDWAEFAYPFNFTQQPAATMPCGFVDGLPVALQIVAPRYREDLALKASRAFETVHPIRLPEDRS